MDRLTKHFTRTIHQNDVCCTHFGGVECVEREGNCCNNCPWEETAWARLAEYEDLEEAGRLLRLPFAPSEKAFTLGTLTCSNCKEMYKQKSCEGMRCPLVVYETKFDIRAYVNGTRYYATREQARAALETQS